MSTNSELKPNWPNQLLDIAREALDNPFAREEFSLFSRRITGFGDLGKTPKNRQFRMILTGDEIHQRMGTDIDIDPFDKSNLNPNSYNLSLHEDLMTYEEVVLDMRKCNRIKRLSIPKGGLTLQPNKLYLGRTRERTETRNLVPMIEGRSSIGRLGLFVHVTAGFGDVGFCGFWTLEMFAIQPVRIYPGVSICQIFYHEVVGNVTDYKSSKYQNNHDIQPSLLFRELNPDAEIDDPQMKLGFET